MEYVVIRSFTDKDSHIHYAVGERYPRRGFASKSRVSELSTANNKRGVALIQEKPADKKEKEEIKKEEVVKEPVQEKKSDPVYYTKADIMTMTVSKLRKVAQEQGIEETGNLSGAKLKEILIEKMGL